jgi:uncharacterized protein YjbI with pentapeptide repeats
MPLPLLKKTRTRFYVKQLTISNTTPTSTTAAANELDNVVRIRTELSGLDFRQSRYTGTSLRHRGYQTTIQMVFWALVLG